MEEPRTMSKISLPMTLVMVLIFLSAFVLMVVKTMELGDKMGQQLEDEVKVAPYETAWVPLPALDSFLKVVHNVFTKHYLVDTIHFWFLMVWVLPCVVLIFFQSIDFSRLSMSFTYLFPFLYQYVGLGLIWPLVMLYYLHRRNSHSGRFQGGSNPARVALMGTSSIVTIIIFAALQSLNRSGPIYFWGVNAFLLVPVIFPLFSFMLPSENAPRSVIESAHGQRWENLIYAIMAGMSCLLYWKDIPYLLEKFIIGAPSITVGLEKAVSQLLVNPVHWMLLWDAVASLSVIFVWLLGDGGFTVTFVALILCPILSPGATIALYLLWRESVIYRTVASASLTSHKVSHKLD